MKADLRRILRLDTNSNLPATASDIAKLVEWRGGERKRKIRKWEGRGREGRLGRMLRIGNQN